VLALAAFHPREGKFDAIDVTGAGWGQGMQGERAQVVFSSPAEISAFIEEGC